MGVDVHRRGADEAGHEDVRRAIVQLGRSTDLLQDAELDDGDAVAHRQSLGLIVGHVQGGDTQLTLQGSDLSTGLHTELGVEVRQRLIHEEDLRLTHDGAAHGHTLTLTTGQSLRLTIEVLGQVEDLGGLLDALADLVLRGAGDLQSEAHVVGDGHVRVQSVVLEHHGDVAILRLHGGDILATDEDAALVDLFQASEHAQGGGLTAARGADQHEELAVLDIQIQIIHRRLIVARVDTSDMVKYDFCHDMFILSEAGTCLTIRCGRWLCVRLQCPTAETVDFGVYLSGPLKVLFFEPRSTIHQFVLMARVAFLGVLTLTNPSRGPWRHRHPGAITVAPARPIRHRPPFAVARICTEYEAYADRREDG